MKKKMKVYTITNLRRTSEPYVSVEKLPYWYLIGAHNGVCIRTRKSFHARARDEVFSRFP